MGPPPRTCALAPRQGENRHRIHHRESETPGCASWQRLLVDLRRDRPDWPSQSAAWRHTRSVCGVSPRCRRDRLLPAQPVEPWLLQRSRMRWRSQRSASVTSEFGKSPNRVTHGDTARLTPALGSCDSGRLAIYGSAARGRSTKGESHVQVLNRSTGPPLIRPVGQGPVGLGSNPLAVAWRPVWFSRTG